MTPEVAEARLRTIIRLKNQEIRRLEEQADQHVKKIVVLETTVAAVGEKARGEAKRAETANDELYRELDKIERRRFQYTEVIQWLLNRQPAAYDELPLAFKMRLREWRIDRGDAS
ncbi:hypothetical protein BKA80DRAFT_308847 [Phyllosticta citrichinensis]